MTTPSTKPALWIVDGLIPAPELECRCDPNDYDGIPGVDCAIHNRADIYGSFIDALAAELGDGYEISLTIKRAQRGTYHGVHGVIGGPEVPINGTTISVTAALEAASPARSVWQINRVLNDIIVT